MKVAHPSLKRQMTRSVGSYIVELPLALWILMVCVAFPLIMLATITLRTTFLDAVAKDAAHAAAKAYTFEAPGEDGKPSAIQLAETAAGETASKFSGITVTSIVTKIAIKDSSNPSSTVEVRTTKLGESDIIDTSKYVYSAQVEVSGEVQPLLTYNLPILGDVPGLTKPLTLTKVGLEMFENAQGLRQ
jgi:hypothetical protein